MQAEAQDSATAETAQRLLATCLPDQFANLRLARDPALWQPLTGGRSNRSWRVPAPGGDCVVKLFRSASACTVFPNDPQAEAMLLRHLQPYSLAPRLLGAWHGPIGPTLIYRHIPGPTWQRDTAAAARLLRRLHALPAPAGLRHGPNGSQALRQEIRAQSRDLASTQAEALLNALPDSDIPPLATPVLLHGDPVPGNIVTSDAGLRLIDWQCPALGDPCLDLATFLSPAMSWLYLGRTLDAAEQQAFLQAYGAPQIIARYHALAPFLHARMAAYCLTRAAQGSQADAHAARLELA